MKHLNDYQKPKIEVANIYGEGIIAAMNAASQNTTSGDIHVYPNADPVSTDQALSKQHRSVWDE